MSLAKNIHNNTCSIKKDRIWDKVIHTLHYDICCHGKVKFGGQSGKLEAINWWVQGDIAENSSEFIGTAHNSNRITV